jgi:hypothetical protein
MNQIEGRDDPGEDGPGASAKARGRGRVERTMLAVLIGAVLVAVVSFAWVAWLQAHRDPTGGSPQDELSVYASDLAPGQRIYWLPDGRIIPPLDTNAGQTEYMALLEYVEVLGRSVPVTVVTEFGEAGREGWAGDNYQSPFPAGEVRLATLSRPGDETVVIYAYKPQDKSRLRKAVLDQLDTYSPG